MKSVMIIALVFGAFSPVYAKDGNLTGQALDIDQLNKPYLTKPPHLNSSSALPASDINKDREIRRLQSLIIDLRVESDEANEKYKKAANEVNRLKEKLNLSTKKVCEDKIKKINAEHRKAIGEERKRGIYIGRRLMLIGFLDRYIIAKEKKAPLSNDDKKELDSYKERKALWTKQINALGYSPGK